MMRTLLTLVVAVLTVQCAQATVRCYACEWDAYNPTQYEYCNTGKGIPDTAIKSNCDMCEKEQHKAKDVLYIKRSCFKMDTVDLGLPKKDCTKVPYEKGDLKYCYCDKELCNSASTVKVGFLFALLSVLASVMMM